MIDVKQITVSFGDLKIIEDLTFSVPKQKICVIKGQSGSGKSTLLKTLLGFVPQFSGEIQINGIELNSKNVAKIRKFTSWLPQQTEIYFDTVKELFFAPFELKANKKLFPTDSQIKQIFQSLNISTDLLDKKISQISGVQKQRIALASVLLLKKPLILLDEPTSALDKGNELLVIDTIRKYAKNSTLLIASHTPAWFDVADLTIDLDQKK